MVAGLTSNLIKREALKRLFDSAEEIVEEVRINALQCNYQLLQLSDNSFS